MKFFTNVKDKFAIDKFSPYEIATIMDFINEYVIKYYLNYLDKEPEPHHLSSLIYKKNKKLNSVKFELTLKIMDREGYIHPITDPDTLNKTLKHTEKGLTKFFSGGFRNEFNKKKREKWLMITGQISIVIAGLYYTLEIIKNVIHCLNNHL
jgi:hypothetical protein